MTDLVETVRTYSNLYGPSGDEDEVIRRFRNDMIGLGYETRVDPLGNVIVPVSVAAPGHPHVMISAHLDEVGFVVRKIEPNGFLRVHRVGGIHDQVIAGQRIDFKTGSGVVQGHVAVKAKHISTPEELLSGMSVDAAYVDVLADSQASAEALGLEVGTFGTFSSTFLHRGDLISGKAMDNRAAVAVLLLLAERLSEHELRAGVTLVGTVQEEFSVRGGVTAARSIRPDFGICFDIAIATDAPWMEEFGDVRLGGGPAITRFTRAKVNGIIPNPKLVAHAKRAAERRGIELQNAVMQGGLTDGSYMQYEGDGIPIIDLSFPTRYTHTAVETCSVSDLRRLMELTLGMIEDLDVDFDLSRG